MHFVCGNDETYKSQVILRNRRQDLEFKRKDVKIIMKKNIGILGTIFVAFLIVATFPLWKGYIGLEDEEKVEHDFNFSVLTESNIQQFAIKHGEDNKVFEKKDGVWKVETFDVFPAEVTSFFENLKELKVKDLTSKNPDNHEKLGLTEEKGYLLTLIHDGKVTDFLIGNAGSSFNSFYLKKRDASEAYLIE